VNQLVFARNYQRTRIFIAAESGEAEGAAWRRTKQHDNEDGEGGLRTGRQAATKKGSVSGALKCCRSIVARPQGRRSYFFFFAAAFFFGAAFFLVAIVVFS